MRQSLVKSPVEKLVSGMSFTEGPVWIAEHDLLLFTDIPANRIMFWSEKSGLKTWIDNAHFSIGLARDKSGRVLCCEHSTRSVTAIEMTAKGEAGQRSVLADRFEGCVLNSTNDVICARDGTILFTDPPFGVRNLEGGLHGYQQASELQACHVFCVTGNAKNPVSVTADVYRPNGLCLSPDEKHLYISDSSDQYHKVMVGDVGSGWTLKNLRDFAVMPRGVPDGMRVDIEGNLWVSGADGVYIYNTVARQIGHVPVPEMVTNVEFGGADLTQLFITATTSIYRVHASLPGITKVFPA